MKAGRGDLIGPECASLIPANPPREAQAARRARTDRDVSEGRYVHQIDREAKGPAAPVAGYRPNRKTARRKPR